jgi:hypothetical protein
MDKSKCKNRYCVRNKQKRSRACACQTWIGTDGRTKQVVNIYRACVTSNFHEALNLDAIFN